jgi:hypothetical protein
MKRKTVGALSLVFVLCAFGSIAEAAQKHSVHHRAKHTTHVTTGSHTKTGAHRTGKQSRASHSKRATTTPK